MKKLFVVIGLVLFICSTVVPTNAFAKGGGGGGGRASSSARSSSSSSSRPTSKPSSSSSAKPSSQSASSKPTSKPSISSKPSTSTQRVSSASTKTVSGKSYGKTGNVVDKNYQPKFRGYSAPEGSVVYYRQNSMLDWLPFYMIWSSQNAHREAVVVEPAKDGKPAKETVVKEEGVDGMYIWNWIFSILVILGLIGLIVWYVNRRTKSYA